MRTQNPQKIIEAIQKIDPTASGELRIIGAIKDKGLGGFLYSSLTQDELIEAADGVFTAAEIETVTILPQKLRLTLVDETKKSGTKATVEPNGDPQELNFDSITSVPVNHIVEGNTLKRKNPEAVSKLENVVRKTRFIAPLVLNTKLEVIDGYLRLDVARALDFANVSAVIVEADERLSSFLRLVLNRSSEFQRWDFEQVDAFADDNLNMTGYLEPYGIFSSNIVPKTFLGETVKNYEISEHNDQQKFYTQSIGLAEWARRIREDEHNTEAPKKTKKANKKNRKPKFGLTFDDEPEGDSPGEDPMDVAQDVREEQREEAAQITVAYDEFRGEKAAEQRVRRSPKQKTLENKLAAESTDVDSESLEEEDID